MKKIIPVILFQLGILFFYTCPATAATRPLLTAIQFESPAAREDRVIFTLNGITRPKIFEIKGKRPRLVVDLPDTGLARRLKNTTKTKGHFVHRIRLGMHKGKNPRTRVVLDLAPNQPIHFDQHFNRENSILIISIYPAGGKTKSAATTNAQAQAPPTPSPGPTIGLQPAGRKSVSLAGQQPKKAEALIAPPSLFPPKPGPALSTEKPAATAATVQGIPESVSPAVPARPAEKTAIKPLPPPTGQLQKPTLTGKTAPVIKSIKFDNDSSRGEIVRFQLNGFYPPTVTGLKKNAPRVGCDFKNATVPGSVKKLIECNGKYIKTIQVEPSHNPDRVKVILNLVPGNKYDLQQIFFKKDNLFVIIINTVNKKITLM
ncbi:MAG: AMIN domain-containing protein [Proteobacteria bacterium]|nr:AMIN domain-containing protein [Pseudomonadota bacterium]